MEKDKLASLLKIWMSFGVVVACISPSIKTSKTVTDVFGHLETGVSSGRNSQFSETVEIKCYYDYLIPFVYFVDVFQILPIAITIRSLKLKLELLNTKPVQN